MVVEEKAMALAKIHIEIYMSECELTDMEEAQQAADIMGYMVHNLIVTLDSPETIIVHGKINKRRTH